MKSNRRTIRMKTRVFIVLLFLVAFALAPANVNAQNTYSATLISPTLGQVLHQGQQFRLEWTATFPRMHLNGSEMEIWLSLDGGKTFTNFVTFIGVTSRYYDWTVPNTPTNAAVLDIPFGREMPYYPETYSPPHSEAFQA